MPLRLAKQLIRSGMPVGYKQLAAAAKAGNDSGMFFMPGRACCAGQAGFPVQPALVCFGNFTALSGFFVGVPGIHIWGEALQQMRMDVDIPRYAKAFVFCNVMQHMEWVSSTASRLFILLLISHQA